MVKRILANCARPHGSNACLDAIGNSFGNDQKSPCQLVSDKANVCPCKQKQNPAVVAKFVIIQKGLKKPASEKAVVVIGSCAHVAEANPTREFAGIHHLARQGSVQRYPLRKKT